MAGMQLSRSEKPLARLTPKLDRPTRSRLYRYTASSSVLGIYDCQPYCEITTKLPQRVQGDTATVVV